MKANELRLGNHIEGGTVSHIGYEKGVFGIGLLENKFDSFHKWVKGDDIKPIPLTEQWLKDFGFEKKIVKSKHFDIDMIHYQNDDCWIYFIGENKDSFEIELNIGDNRCNLYRTWKYVHQLQNLFYCLTGKELTK